MEHTKPVLLRSAGKEQEYKRHTIMSWGFVIGEAALGVLLLFGFFFRPAAVQDGAMAPTLSPNEVLLIDRLSMYIETPARGEIQLLPDGSLRRVVAFAGERVELCDGLVYINSCALDESAYLAAPCGSTDEPVTVPEGCMLLLPDDRSVLLSAVPEGDVLYSYMTPVEQLRGAVRVRVSPMDKINLFAM